MTSSVDLQGASLEVQIRRHPSAAWITLRGESDISNREDLATALDDVELDGTRSVHLHLDALDFCDVAGVRLLCAFAADMRRVGREVMTCGARPSFRKLVRMLGVQRELGLS